MRSSTAQSYPTTSQGHHPPLDAGVTVEGFIAGCRSRNGRLPFEIGAFLALETCEALQESGPRVVSAHDVSIDQGGYLSLAPLRRSSDQDAANSVLALLAHLLVASGTGVPAVLLHLVEFGPTTGQWRLATLRDELEASLLPLNRGAARRVLGRMLRETRSRAVAEPVPRADVVDADLDALLLGREMPVEPPAMRGGPVPFSEVIAQSARRPTRGARGGVKRPSEPSSRQARAERRPLGSELDDSPPRSFGLGRWGIIVAVGLGCVAFVLAGGLEPSTIESQGSATAGPVQVSSPARADRGDLFVQAENSAQILLFVGRGPALATQLPVGVAHEFVVISDGHAPSRVTVPADARWLAGPERSRLELNVEPNPAVMAFEDLRLGQTTLSRAAMGEPSGDLGDILVRTSPEGARVFLLIGFGSASVENLSTTQPQELLIVEDGSTPRRVFVGPSDWTPRGGGLTPLAHIQP